MNQFILLCLVGAAWATHTGNANVVPSDATQEQYNQSVDKPVHTRDYPGVQLSTPSYTPGYSPVYGFSRSAPTVGPGYKVAGTSVPFYPYVVTSVPEAGVADTRSYPYIPFPYPPIPHPAATRSYLYFPFPVPPRPNQAVTTAAADCPFWPLC